jgi:hypothetical protein
MTETQILEFIEKYAALFATTVLGGWIGAYIGGYLKQKGQNLATHEDIKGLVDQVSAVTRATKEIEAKISIDMWSKQQRWEVQKAALLDSLRELASSESTLWALVHALKLRKNETEADKLYRQEANERYSTAINAFWRTKLATAIVCGGKIADKLEELDHRLAIVAVRAREGNFRGIWDDNFDAIQKAKQELAELIRKNLNFGEELGEFRLPSSESSTGSKDE